MNVIISIKFLKIAWHLAAVATDPGEFKMHANKKCAKTFFNQRQC